MVKQFHLFTARDGIEPDALSRAYETELLPALRATPGLTGLCANVVIPGASVKGAHIADTPPPPAFNLIVALWLDGSAISDAPARRDVPSLADYGRRRVFDVEEHETPSSLLDPMRPAPNDPAQVKMICMIKRRPGMSRQAFIDYYETGHSRLAARHLRMIAGYRRNYPLEGQPIDIDVVTEMWFRNKADHEALVVAMGDPQLGAMFAEDEARLFDRNTIQMFLVTENTL
jgi:hypothetical protein